jgi:hypothetical protein
VGLRSHACWYYGFESRQEHGCLSLVNVVCCQLEFSASGSSLVQRSPTECGVSEYNREASIMRRLWPTRGCCEMEKKLSLHETQFRSRQSGDEKIPACT